MEQIVQNSNDLIKVRTQALLQDFFKKHFKGSKEELEDKAIQSIKGELAIKDFVEAKVSEAKLELKEELSHLKLYVIAAIILIVVLQPRVFDFLTSIFK